MICEVRNESCVNEIYSFYFISTSSLQLTGLREISTHIVYITCIEGFLICL
jgi:hypothetical protein